MDSDGHLYDGDSGNVRESYAVSCADRELRYGTELAHLLLRIYFMLRICIVGLLVLSGCGKSGPPVDGVWVLRYQSKNLMVLRLDKDGKHGTLTAPQHIESSGSSTFPIISGPVEDRHGLVRLENQDRMLKLDTDDELVLHVNTTGRLEVRRAGALMFSPWIFTRAEEIPKVATSWIPPATPEIAAVQVKLTAMEEEDQFVRTSSKILMNAVAEVDARHLPELRSIHDTYGWPKQSEVGPETARAFFLLVQHQGPELQRAWIGEMERRVGEKEASGRDYSLLYDRVQKGLGKPQRWGNSVACTDGKATLDPVEDPANLDARRRELNLIPMDEYLRKIQELCTTVAP